MGLGEKYRERTFLWEGRKRKVWRPYWSVKCSACFCFENMLSLLQFRSFRELYSAWVFPSEVCAQSQWMQYLGSGLYPWWPFCCTLEAGMAWNVWGMYEAQKRGPRQGYNHCSVKWPLSISLNCNSWLSVILWWRSFAPRLTQTLRDLVRERYASSLG